jgi:hypothetical protein
MDRERTDERITLTLEMRVVLKSIIRILRMLIGLFEAMLQGKNPVK